MRFSSVSANKYQGRNSRGGTDNEGPGEWQIWEVVIRHTFGDLPGEHWVVDNAAVEEQEDGGGDSDKNYHWELKSS